MDVILKYFKELDDQQHNRLQMLYSLYLEWNEKINVISRKDIQFLNERHILHSLAIAKIIRFNPGTKILDVGTGGGFPGIPLAVMFPDVSFHLIDSIGKKIKVVKAIAEKLGLKNVSACHTRVQEVNEKFDFIVSRAVTNLPDFVSITKNVVKEKEVIKNQLPPGILYLKGGDFLEELQAINYRYSVFDLSDFFEEPFFSTKKLIHILIK